MRHRFLESILVCLTLAASVVSAQETPDRVRLTTSDGQVIELAEEHEVIAGILRISVEELQRRIDAGEELSLGFDVTIRDVVAVDGAVVNYDPPQFPAPQFFVNPPHMDEYIEEMRQLGEKRRQRDELHREILNETGISEGQWEQFRGIVTGIESKHEQAAEQLENSIDIDSLTPNDLAGLFIGKFIQPMHNDYRTEAVNLFGEEQYAQLAARYYQVIELGGEFGKDQFGLLPVGEDELDKEVSQLFMLPDVIDLTKEQLAGLAQIQKEFISGHFEFEIMREQEEELLKTQLSEAQTNEEQADIQERLNGCSSSNCLKYVSNTFCVNNLREISRQKVRPLKFI